MTRSLGGAVKLARAKSLESGVWGVHDLFFAYGEEDLRLLFLTRTLSRLHVPRAAYRDLFGADLLLTRASLHELGRAAAGGTPG